VRGGRSIAQKVLLLEFVYIARVTPQAVVKPQLCHASCFLSPKAVTTRTLHHDLSLSTRVNRGARLAVVIFVHDLDIVGE